MDPGPSAKVRKFWPSLEANRPLKRVGKTNQTSPKESPGSGDHSSSILTRQHAGEDPGRNFIIGGILGGLAWVPAMCVTVHLEIERVTTVDHPEHVAIAPWVDAGIDLRWASQ